MKKRIPSFLAGALTMALALTLTTTALAASGNVTFSFANIALNGETKIAAGTTITADNGQEVPGSILYTDAAGGKTNYLPIRAICDLLGVEIGYDSAAKTVLLGEQSGTVMVSADQDRWKKTVDGNTVTYTCDETDASYESVPLYRPTWQADGWGLASLTTDHKGIRHTMWRYLGDSGSISLTCANPAGGSYGFMPGPPYIYHNVGGNVYMRNFMHIEDRRAPAGGTCGGKRFFFRWNGPRTSMQLLKCAKLSKDWKNCCAT